MTQVASSFGDDLPPPQSQLPCDQCREQHQAMEAELFRLRSQVSSMARREEETLSILKQKNDSEDRLRGLVNELQLSLELAKLEHSTAFAAEAQGGELQPGGTNGFFFAQTPPSQAATTPPTQPSSAFASPFLEASRCSTPPPVATALPGPMDCNLSSNRNLLDGDFHYTLDASSSSTPSKKLKVTRSRRETSTHAPNTSLSTPNGRCTTRPSSWGVLTSNTSSSNKVNAVAVDEEDDDDLADLRIGLKRLRLE